MMATGGPSGDVIDAADSVVEWMRDSGLETDFMRQQLGVAQDSPHAFSQAFQRVHGSPPAAPPQPQSRLPRGSRSPSRGSGASQEPNWPGAPRDRAKWETAAERMLQRHVSQDPNSGQYRIQEVSDVVERILEPDFAPSESEARRAGQRSGTGDRDQSLERAVYRYSAPFNPNPTLTHCAWEQV